MMVADSESALVAKLNQMGYVPVSVREKRESASSYRLFDRFVSVGFAELNMFTRQLATLQKAGLPLLLSLGVLKEQTPNNKFKSVLERIVRDIESGINFSDALKKFPGLFNSLYVNMIASGEAGGKMDEVLERLAYLGEYDEKIKQRVKVATRYPVMVVIAMLIGFLIVTTLVVPRFARIYGQFRVVLPLPTRILIGVHDIVANLWWLVALVVVALAGGFRWYIQTPQGRLVWDTIKLKIPVFGPLFLKLALARFTRVTGMLMHSGLPLLNILQITSESTGNAFVSRIIDDIKKNISEGKGMSEPMKASGIFPAMVTQMVAVGEETGKLDELLIFVSGYYDEQVEYTIGNLTSLIEPFLIFVLGCGVLLMALGIFLPMWSLMSLFTGK